ncbi:MAG: amino acid--tRNA ligase-related protein, partial [Candidatus Omnitrophota bacterium]
HPFTNLHPEDIPLLSDDRSESLLKIRSCSYDMVLNGIELGSGSIRIHDRGIQEKVFKVLRLSPQEQRERFGFLLDAFTYGAPPHGGIAFGLDRLMAMLVDLRDGRFSDTEEATSIREVIAFPKTQKGTCPLTVAPSDVPPDKLKELGIEISKK